MNYNTIINKRKPLNIPYLVFKGWKLSNQGLIPPDDSRFEVLTPGKIQLLYWKASFYDRGMTKSWRQKEIEERINPR